MKTPRSWALVLVPIGLIAASLASGDAQAVIVQRTFHSNPTGLCNSALPVFEVQIRKRPLAIQNEGGSGAFVTCSFTSQGTIKEVKVYFSSNDNAAHDVSCTGVSGNVGGTPEYLVKSTTVAANGDPTALVWSGFDFAGAPTFFPSAKFGISCLLPPGAGVNDSALWFQEDVSA